MASASAVRGERPPPRRRLALCVDGPDKAGRHGASGPLTKIYNILACVKEGEVIDRDGVSWIQERHYGEGGALKEHGTFGRLKSGIAGNDTQDLIESVYKKCCELSKDDEVWLFGAGRGAYAVRAVAGLLHYIRRLKSSGSDFHQDYKKALKVYAAVQGKRELGARQINHMLQCDTLPAPVIRFVGAFDTIKAIDDSPFDLSLNDSVQHLRHALALHEDRRDFVPESIFPESETLNKINTPSRSFVQAWFVGTHNDIIGATADQAGLSLYPLQWMLLECRNLGLALEFHGNSQYAPIAIDNPLELVFPPDDEHGKGAELWSCTSENGICTSMQDLRKVHELPVHGSRYRVAINGSSGRWLRKPRDPFMKKHQNPAASILEGYYSNGPIGTIIHPSVYSLIDESVTIIMETKHAQLVQNLSEWSSTMLGEIEHTIDDGATKITKMVPNPGFWSRSDNFEVDVDSLPPLRILVCGYTGVGKSNLVSKVFGVDLGIVSERRSGIHNVHQEIRIEGRDDLILHDSKGFEGGGIQELEDVRHFIRKRATEPKLADRLHMIWFCLEANTTRTTQTASHAIFEALHDCHGDVPVVLVATKKDQFLNMRFGERMSEFESEDGETTPEQFAECRRYAQEELDKRAQLMVDEISSLKGGRVDAWVCVSRNDQKSIDQLTERSSSVFRDESTRLMYVKAQMTRPDLKINMAIFMAMRRYRHAVGAATTGGLFPLLPTMTRQGMKDDICRRIVACFGIKDLEAKHALKLMKDNISESTSVRGMRTYWGEALAVLSMGSIYMASPVTAPAAAVVLVPHMAHLFLCTACDLILILAKSFQVGSYSGRAQPQVLDVETAARAVRDHMEPIHAAIVELIPPNKPLATFRYGTLQVKVQDLVENNWKRLASDTSFTKDALLGQTARSSSSPSRLAIRPHERIKGPLELAADREVVEADSRTVYPELE